MIYLSLHHVCVHRSHMRSQHKANVYLMSLSNVFITNKCLIRRAQKVSAQKSGRKTLNKIKPLQSLKDSTQFLQVVRLTEILTKIYILSYVVERVCSRRVPIFVNLHEHEHDGLT